MDNTFFNLKLDLEPNIIDMLYDLLRMSTIQIITQIMFYMNNSSLSLFNETFVKTFIFINISIVFYYLIVRKVFSLISDDYLNTFFKEVSKPYAGTPPIGSSQGLKGTSISSGIKSLTPSSPPPPPPPAPRPATPPTSNSGGAANSVGSTPLGSTPISNNNNN